MAGSNEAASNEPDPSGLGGDRSEGASLKALSEIATTINSLQEPEKLLEKVMEIAMERLEAERGFILIRDDEAESGFEVRTSRNFTEEEVDELVLSTTAVREVLEGGEPELVYETQEDERYREAESIVLQEIQSIACVPLRIKERQIGAIYLDSLTSRGRFTRESLPFLEAFAHQAAVALENAQLYQSLREENRQLRSEIQSVYGFDEIVGQSEPMQAVFDRMSRVLDSDASVLVQGESGTGKELVARALHYNGSRQEEPFVSVFCGSLPDDLLESELFGHVEGAFTGAVADKEGLFQEADGGTIFLDEVGDLSPRMQTALLRVLQEGEIKRVGENQTRTVDVRVISATHQDLREMIEEDTFREDLFYRLNTIDISLPPLRHRRGDVPLLAHHFLDRYADREGKDLEGFEEEAMDRLKRYSWPGNVRELEKTVERAVVLARGELITEEDLDLPEEDRRDPFEPGLTLAEVERRVIERTLEDCDGNVSQTARVLDISRRSLHYKLNEWESQDE